MVLDQIQKCVQELKVKYPNFSSSQIAAKIGIDQSTFSRIENGQVKNFPLPNLDSIVKLLIGTGKTFTLTKVIEMFNPALASLLKQNMSHNAENTLMGPDIAYYIKLPVYRDIILLASTRTGTTYKEVKEECGKLGLNKLNELLRKGICKESEGAIHTTEKGVKVTFDQYTLSEVLVNCTKDHYLPENFGLGMNWLSFQTESVDKEKVLKLIRSKIQNFYGEIEQIIRSPEYHGNEKIFIGMVLDSITKGSSNDLKGVSE